MATDTKVETKTFQVDSSHSRVGFAVRHMMLAKVRGHFGKISGSLVLEGGQTVPTSIQAEIDVTSIDTREPQRDTHLRSPDFFDTEKFPTITFKSTEIKPGSGNEFTATGDLTIHGTTKPLTLTVEAEGRITDPYGKDRAAYTARGRVHRKEFGLVWNQAMETGGVMVGDDVDIELEIEAVGE
ncbi:MAG: YceI family protein [Candidatus Eremiobacteraeota bacterium]|nr:YceI family protein [Candidatus Eremiobacteraeota bacterium]